MKPFSVIDDARVYRHYTAAADFSALIRLPYSPAMRVTVYKDDFGICQIKPLCTERVPAQWMRQ